MTGGAQAAAGRLMVVGDHTRECLPSDSPIVVGRDGGTSGIRVHHDLVSRRHARLVFDEGWLLEDLQSTNGIWRDGERVDRLRITGEVCVRLGDPDTGPELRMVSAPEQQHQPSAGGSRRLVIGRDPEAWLTIADPMASWRHAELEEGSSGWHLRDLGSTNQTIVNGRPVDRQLLARGDRVLIGNSLLEFDGAALSVVEGTRFAVQRASLAIRGGRRIVDDVSFSMTRPSLVAVIGPSGAGKSSLLRLVTGQVSPTSGSVSLDGATMTSQRRAHRGKIGVVPQHTVAHRSLTARQALDFTARLRLPMDVGHVERGRLIDGLVEQLGLTPHADTRIERLSGGQQRRVGIAMEMLTDPSMLILDEPTAGLDPSLVLQIMTLLRRLADDGKRVFVVTHDLEHLGLVDQVLVLRAGGTVAYSGPPEGVFAHFGTTSWAETFAQLSVPAATAPTQQSDSGPAMRAAYDLPETSIGLRMLGRSAAVVLLRQLRLIVADPMYLLLLLGMPVALGVLALAVPGSDGLGPTSDPASVEASRLLVLVIVGAAFLGLSVSVRDLVGEREIYEHERDAGLSPLGYLAAKMAVFAFLAAGQSIVLVGFLSTFRAPPPDPVLLGSGVLELTAATVATALTGVAAGLAISSRVATTEQSMPPLVLLVMGQLVMCGGLFPIDGGGPLATLSWFFPTRWGYAAGASTVDLNNLSRAVDDDGLWTHTAQNWIGCMLLLLLLACVLVVVAARGVTRRRKVL